MARDERSTVSGRQLAEATERTAKHGETEQRRRTEKSGSTGRPAQQADLALLDRIGNTNASSRDGARVSDPIRQRASLRDARRTALRVTPLLRVSVFGRYFCLLRCVP